MSDFGLAQVVKEIKQQDATNQSEIKPPNRGTPHYMAPVLHFWDTFSLFLIRIIFHRNYLLVGVFHFILIYGL